jgi:hypothetical protein
MPYAALTAAAPVDPAALLGPLPATNKLRGNPDLALVPHRGARTRAGGPRRSRASQGKLCCPAGQARGQAPHRGRSPGPLTPESLPQGRLGDCIRVREARTIHGSYGANARAENRRPLTLLRISRVNVSLDRYQAHLPPAPSANRPPQGAPTPGPTAPFKPFRVDPLNREPAAKLGSTASFKPSRIDP